MGFIKRVSCLRYIGILVSCLLPSLALSDSLTGFVDKRHQDFDHGRPVIFLEGTKNVHNASNLQDFGRKIVDVGGVTVLAPIEMVQINDPYKFESNLYEGLEVQERVLVLLAMLSDDQLKLVASGAGIGFPDLHGEQKQVFESILPDPFHVSVKPMEGSTDDVLTKLNDDQRKKVRLRISKTYSISMQLAGSKNFVSKSSADYSAGKRFPQYSLGHNDPKETLFGVPVLKRLPNQLKKSQLDYDDSRLETLVALRPSQSLKEALNTIQQKTNFQLIADPRVATRTLNCVNLKSIKASDLLRSLAILTTGTFRKVGTKFLLTSNIEGSGMEVTRTAFWLSEQKFRCKQELQTRSGQLAKGRLLDILRSDEQDQFQLSKEAESFVDESDRQGISKPLPNDFVKGDLEAFLSRYNRENPETPVTKENIQVSGELHYQFQMPTGEPIMGRGDILPIQFLAYLRKGTKELNLSKIKMPVQNYRALVIGSDAIGSSQSMIDKASELGFHEIWLQSDKKASIERVIQEASAKNISVRLYLCPWQVHDDVHFADLNLLGQATTDWLAKRDKISFPDAMAFARGCFFAGSSHLSPDNRPSSWNHLRELNSISGLKEPVFAEIQPVGYESQIGGGISNFDGPTRAVLQTGYALSMRSEFLNQFGVDPIDLIPEELDIHVDINPLYFANMESDSRPQVEDSRITLLGYQKEWNTFKSTTLAAGLKEFGERLGLNDRENYWIEFSRSTGFDQPTNVTYLGQTKEGRLLEYRPNTMKGILVKVLVDGQNSSNEGQVIDQWKYFAGAIKNDVVLDCHLLNAEKTLKVLDLIKENSIP